MTISRRQANTANSSYNAAVLATTSLAVTLDAPALAGSVLVAGWSVDKSSGAFTAPTGWTVLANVNGTQVSLLVAYKVAAGGETSASASWATAERSGSAVIVEYRGVDPTTPFGPSTVPGYNDTARTLLSMSAGPAVTDGLALAFLTIDSTVTGGSGAFNPTADGYSSVAHAYVAGDSGGSAIQLLEAPVASGKTESPTFAWSDSDQVAGALTLMRAVPTPASSGGDSGWQLLKATSSTRWEMVLSDGQVRAAPVADIQASNAGRRLHVSGNRSFTTNKRRTVVGITGDVFDDGPSVNLPAGITPVPSSDLRFYWDFGDGKGEAFTSSADYTYEEDGAYEVTLSVTDRAGESASISKVVTVWGVESVTPPVARFTWRANGNTIRFDGSGSSDRESAVHGYSWSWGDGTGGFGRVVEKTFPDTGVYAVTLTVEDDNGQTGYLTRAVEVFDMSTEPVNTAPIAEFAATVTGTKVTVNAAASKDPGGQIKEFRWAFGDGATGTGSLTSRDYGKAGTWQIQLTVVDDDGAFSSITRQVQTSTQTTTPTTPPKTTTPTPTPTTPTPTPTTPKPADPPVVVVPSNPAPTGNVYTAGSMFQGIPSSIRVYTLKDLGLSSSVTGLQRILDALPGEGIVQLPGGGWTGSIPNMHHHGSNWGINQTKLRGLLGEISGGALQTRVKLAGKVLTATQLSTLAAQKTGTTQIGAYANSNGKSHYIAGINFVGADQQAIHGYRNPAGKSAPARYAGFHLDRSGADSIFQNVLMQGFGRADHSSPPGEIGNWSEAHTSRFLFRRVEHDGRIPGVGSDPYAMGWRRGGGIQWNQAAGFLVEDVYSHDCWVSGFTVSFTSLPSDASKMSHDYTTRRLRVANNAGWGTSSVTGDNSGTFRPINMEFNYGTVHHYQPQLDSRVWAGDNAHIKLWMNGPIGGTNYTGRSDLKLFVHQPKWSSSHPQDNGCFSIFIAGQKQSGMANPVVYLKADESKPATAYKTSPGKQVPSYVTTANNYYVLKGI